MLNYTFEVIDTGIGLRQRQPYMLFERIQGEQEELSLGVMEDGLGLAICRNS
jgi:K+-sensing histidine kinase KdpD